MKLFLFLEAHVVLSFNVSISIKEYDLKKINFYT